MSHGKSEAYSPLKITRHLNVIQDIRDGRVAPPVHVQLIISDLCNHSCGFCAYRDPGYTSSQLFYQISAKPGGLRRDGEHPERDYNPNRQIPWPKIKEILADCADMGVRAIQYTGGGEPTVHPQWLEAIVETDRLGMDAAMVSNGVLIQNQRDAELTALCKWVRISIDAGDAATYAGIRGCSETHFQRAWDAVTFLRRARERMGTGTLLGVGFVVTPDNWGGVLKAARLAKTAGDDNFRISAQFSSEAERPFSGFAKACADLCEQAESELNDKHFHVFNRFSSRLDDLKQAPDYDRCGYQYVTTYIGGDQNAYRCCIQSYNDRGLLGSIKDQKFSQLWNAQRRLHDMQAFDARSCAACQFNNINRTLDYVLNHDDPTHSNFI